LPRDAKAAQPPAENSRGRPLREGDRDAVVLRSHPLHRGLRGSAVTQTVWNAAWPLCIGGFRAAGNGRGIAGAVILRRWQRRLSNHPMPSRFTDGSTATRPPRRPGATPPAWPYQRMARAAPQPSGPFRYPAESPGAARREGGRSPSRSLTAGSATP